jgi:hypothetical protein
VFVYFFQKQDTVCNITRKELFLFEFHPQWGLGIKQHYLASPLLTTQLAFIEDLLSQKLTADNM